MKPNGIVLLFDFFCYKGAKVLNQHDKMFKQKDKNRKIFKKYNLE